MKGKYITVLDYSDGKVYQYENLEHFENGWNGDNKDDSPYLHRGIANRGFTRTFNLSETIEVKNASLINGMLKVFLEDIVPENKKPRKVGINKKEETKGEPQILNG